MYLFVCVFRTLSKVVFLDELTRREEQEAKEEKDEDLVDFEVEDEEQKEEDTEEYEDEGKETSSDDLEESGQRNNRAFISKRYHNK